MSFGSLAHKENSASAENGERRTSRLDRGGVDSSSELGAVTQSVRTGKKPRGKRDPSSYIQETTLKALKVLEALEGRAFEPASIRRVSQRTGFSESFCRAALITFKQAGYAKETLDGWIVGPKLARFAARITAHSGISE